MKDDKPAIAGLHWDKPGIPLRKLIPWQILFICSRFPIEPGMTFFKSASSYSRLLLVVIGFRLYHVLPAQPHTHAAMQLPKSEKHGVEKQSNQPKESDFYRMVDYALPENLALEGGGVCAIPGGKIAVSTRRGEVWIVHTPYGLSADARPTYKRFARGLHEILGLKYRDGSLWCAQRGELTRLTDTDGDGEADQYQCVARLPTVGHYHEYSYGPSFDSQGNAVVSLNVAFGSADWYNGKSYAPWRGWVIKVKPDGQIEPWAAGVRSPCGVGIGPEDKVFYTENQGDWIGSGYFTVLEKGDFMACPPSLRWADAEGSIVKARLSDVVSAGKPMFEVKKDIPGLRLPSVWLPHGVLGVSTSDFILDSMNGKFGPFEGQYLIGDQGQSKIDRVFLEKVKGVYQGAAFGFREGFGSGVLRLAWGTDASLFVGQTNRGWASTGPAPFALQRLIWTGRTPFEMHSISARPDGFEIRFTGPVDEVSANNPASYGISSFIYKYHQTYGSPVINEGNCPLKAIILAPDRKSVRLVCDSLRQYYIHEVKADGVLSEQGYELLHSAGYYTLNELPDGDRIDLTKVAPLKIVKPVPIMPEVKVAAKPGKTSLPSTMKASEISAFKVAANLKKVNAMPPSWKKGPDKVITLGTTPGMRYDRSKLELKVGQKVKLVFNNYDDMQHNLVIVKPKSTDRVGAAAAKLGMAGNKLSYIPASDDVLFHTSIIQPTSNQAIYFEVPPFEGEYGFVCTMPGHYMLMRGVISIKR